MREQGAQLRHGGERVGARELGQVRKRRQRAQRPQRLTRQAGESAREHLEVARLAFARVVVARWWDLAALGALVQQDREDLVARDAVDHRVVDLRQQRDMAVRQPVDQVDLP